jgi:hypothetical protein
MMKTIKTLFVACVFLAAGITKSYAGGNESMNQAYNQLNKQLKELFKQIPGEKLNSAEPSHFVVLTFSVNRKHKIENIKVDSTDEKLTRYVRKVLVREKVKVDPLFDGKSGQVSMQIENEG